MQPLLHSPGFTFFIQGDSGGKSVLCEVIVPVIVEKNSPYENLSNSKWYRAVLNQI